MYSKNSLSRERQSSTPEELVEMADRQSDPKKNDVSHVPDKGVLAVQETQSEQRLRVSELRYRRLFEAARDGILILETDTGRISDVNPFLVVLLGFSHD